MKINRIYLFQIGIAITCLFTFLGCADDTIPVGPKDNYVYMPQASGNRARLQLPRIEEAQEVVFGAAYAGTQPAKSDVIAIFEWDNELITEYNAANGTDYIPLPEEAYELGAMTTTILAGKTSSDPLHVSIWTSRLDATKRYMFPIKMVSVSNGILDTAMAITWFRIDAIVVRERDITNQSSVSVSDENNGGPESNEGSLKLIDGDYNTKFLTFGYSPNFWMQLTFASQQVISAYTLTSGNDAPDRDPRDWILSGSNDGTTWVELDAREGETFSGRNLTRRFEINNEEAYRFYRIQVTANGGASLFQLSEWRVIEYY